MKKVILGLTIAALFIPVLVHAATDGGQSIQEAVDENVEELDPQSINPDLVPEPAYPGESVEGRTELTTPQQDSAIEQKYKELMSPGGDTVKEQSIHD